MLGDITTCPCAQVAWSNEESAIIQSGLSILRGEGPAKPPLSPHSVAGWEGA